MKKPKKGMNPFAKPPMPMDGMKPKGKAAGKKASKKCK
jgi:hypothetical protein